MSIKQKISWHEVEREYRIGKKTNVRIADEYGISEGTIRKRAKKEGWTRDLKNQIKERADQIVQQKAIERLVVKEQDADNLTIEENAQLTANVRLSHRQDIARARTLTMNLLGDLEAQVGIDNRARLEDLFIAALKAGAVDASQLEAYERVTSLAGHMRIAKDLADTMTKWITLERQAYGLDDMDSSPVDALTTLLHSIATNNSNAFTVVKDDPEYDKPASNSIGISEDDDA